MEEVKCPSCKGHSEKGACSHCRKRLKKILNELIAFIDLLNSSPKLRQQVSSQQEGRGSMSQALIINVQIVDLISKHGVRSVLQSWAECIIEERGLDSASINATKEKSKLHAIQHLLEIHHDWLAEKDLWPDYYNEIKEPWTTLKRIVYGERKLLRTIKCPVQDCIGTLKLQNNGDVHCLTDSTHIWLYAEWSRLAKLLIEPAVQI